MYFSCIKCGQLKKIPDSVYGKSAKCPKCGTVQELNGMIDLKKYTFNYSCSCGFNRTLAPNHFGKSSKCPKCNSINTVNYIYTDDNNDAAANDYSENKNVKQERDIEKQEINEPQKTVSPENNSNVADKRELLDILKQTIKSFDAISAGSDSPAEPISKKKQSINELFEWFLILCLSVLAYIRTSPPSFMFFLSCIQSVEFLWFILKAVLLGLAVSFVIFFIAACGQFNLSNKLKRNIFEVASLCSIIFLILFGYNFVERSIERTSIKTISEKYQNTYEVSPKSIERIKDGYYRGIAVLTSSTNKYTIKYASYVDVKNKKNPNIIYTKWNDSNLE